MDLDLFRNHSFLISRLNLMNYLLPLTSLPPMSPIASEIKSFKVMESASGFGDHMVVVGLAEKPFWFYYFSLCKLCPINIANYKSFLTRALGKGMPPPRPNFCNIAYCAFSDKKSFKNVRIQMV